MSDYPTVSPSLYNPISENLQKLAALFPAVVKDGLLDIEALREELGDFQEIQPGDEKYELNWVGKKAAKKKAFEPLLGKTLKFLNNSKHPETTQNLFIEGDNLEALKLLRQNYFGEVKMIYIDPPYNTGKDFIYRDNFKISRGESEEEEGVVSEAGERLVKNEKTSNRYHARWLDMMYPRLRLAKDLLREDGVIFISIDDNEADNLKKICNEIFGEENFISECTVISNPRGRQSDTFVANVHDKLLVYARDVTSAEINGMPLSESQRAEFSLIDESGARYRLLGLRQRGAASNREDRPDMFFPIYVHPDTKELSFDRIDGWEAVYPKKSDGRDGRWMWGKAKCVRDKSLLLARLIAKRGEHDIFVKDFLEREGEERTKKFKSLWDSTGYNNQVGTQEVKGLFDADVMSFPKPRPLLEDICRMGAGMGDSSIILDFFAGSATTAHAVMQLNAEDGGNRRFIMVQLPEPTPKDSEARKAGFKTIGDISRKRIELAGEKIKADNPLTTQNLDIGFKSFRIEDTKINWLKKDLRGGELDFAGTSEKDALDFVPGFTDVDIVYELMLRQANIHLTEKIQTLTKAGDRTYLYGESYVICLEEQVSKDLVEILAMLEPTPLKFFFRDSAFGKDIALKDETFRRLNAEIAKNSDVEAAYTVEFI